MTHLVDPVNRGVVVDVRFESSLPPIDALLRAGADLEIALRMLQAYIFSILAAVYIASVVGSHRSQPKTPAADSPLAAA